MLDGSVSRRSISIFSNILCINLFSSVLFYILRHSRVGGNLKALERKLTCVVTAINLFTALGSPTKSGTTILGVVHRLMNDPRICQPL